MLYFLEYVFPFKEGHGIYSFKKKKTSSSSHHQLKHDKVEPMSKKTKITKMFDPNFLTYLFSIDYLSNTNFYSSVRMDPFENLYYYPPQMYLP